MFKVKKGNQVINLDPEKLIELLLRKVVVDQQPEVAPVMAVSLAKRLEAQGLTTDMSIVKALTLGIQVGYYLNTFFRKNEVSIKGTEDEATDSHAGSTVESP